MDLQGVKESIVATQNLSNVVLKSFLQFMLDALLKLKFSKPICSPFSLSSCVERIKLNTQLFRKVYLDNKIEFLANTRIF